MSNSQTKKIVHYCCANFQQSVGGVPRYDYQIYCAFPDRIFIQGPQQKQQLLQFLWNNKNNVIVITDNHLACDIPNEIPTVLVHHGCAQTHADREIGWDSKGFFTGGQHKMLLYRNPKTTIILSISQFCTDEFIKHYKNDYIKFKRLDLLHPSELDENIYKKKFNNTPQVLGNWQGENKGENLVPILKKNIPNFSFNKLSLYPQNGESYQDFNKRKQDIYLQNDIFLQISNSEGNSYATLDALICGLPIVSSNVGLFYKDVPEDCFVKLEWERNGDAEYVQEKLEYAWEHRERLSKNARKWYMETCRFPTMDK